MSINNAESILIIILSCTLVIFLTVGIVVGVLTAKLISSARELVKKAEHFVDSAESAAAAIKNVGGPLAAFKLIRNVMEMFNKKRK